MIRNTLIGLAALLAAMAVFMALKMLQPPPDDLDLRTERESSHGLYLVSFRPMDAGMRPGPIHPWIVTIRDTEGNPVEGAAISVDGGMPQHGHGLPTSPAMKADMGGGKYLVDGVKFSMSGWWEFKIGIDAPQGADEAVFNVVIE